MADIIIPASSAEVWGSENGCPGSIKMQISSRSFRSTEAAQEGKEAHKLAESLIVGSPAPEETTDEMRAAASMYSMDVAGVMAKSMVFGQPDFGVETPTDCSRIHPNIKGRVDSYLYDRKNSELYIWDFKYGFSQTKVYENLQMVSYAAGLLDRLGIDGLSDQTLKIHFRIVQPRGFNPEGPIREWVTYASSLRPLFNQLSSKAEEAISENPTLKSGPHCKKCDARYTCPVALEAGVSLWETARSGIPNSESVDPGELSRILSLVTRARKHLEDLEESYSVQAEMLIKSGITVPGYALQAGRSSVSWDKPKEEVLALGELYGIDLVSRLKTPKQAISAGLDEQAVAAYSKERSGAVKLAALDPNKIKQTLKGE